MIEMNVRAQQQIDQGALEAGAFSGVQISLEQLVGFYYQPDAFPRRDQITDKIEFVCHSILESDEFFLAPEAVIPLLMDRKPDISSPPIGFPDTCFKLDLSVHGKEHMENAHGNLMSILDRHPKRFKEMTTTRDIPFGMEDINIYKMVDASDKISMRAGMSDQGLVDRTPYIIVHTPYSPLGDPYFQLKIVVFHDADSEASLDLKNSSSVFEMRIMDEHNASLATSGARINLDTIGIPWNSTPAECFASVSSKFIEALKQDITAEVDDLYTSDDPDDIFDLIMLTGRIVYLSSLIQDGTDHLMIPEDLRAKLQNAMHRTSSVSREVEGMTAMDQIYYELRNRGEDFIEEIDELKRMLAESFLTNETALRQYFTATGLDKIFPLPGAEVERAFQSIVKHFNPFSEVVMKRDGDPTKEELINYAYYMRFCLSLASATIENKESYLKHNACFILKDGKSIALSFLEDSFEPNQDLEAVLQLVAEKLHDPDLTGCDIVFLYAPKHKESYAIRERRGIRRVIYAVKNPYLLGEDVGILEDSSLERYVGVYGKPPKVIKGLSRRRVLQYYKEYDVFTGKLEQRSIDRNYTGQMAGDYGRNTRELTRAYGSLERRKIESVLGNNLTGLKVLDAGCNNGDDADWMEQKGAEVEGIDISPEAISSAKREHVALAAHFREGNISSLPYEDSSFDAIVCKYALNEMSATDIVKTYKEFYRCLKPGGKLLLFIHHPISQMLFPDATTGEVIMDNLGHRQVSVKVYPDIPPVVEPVHTIQQLIPLDFLQNFRLDELDEGQDVLRIHPNMNIAETLFISAHKE